MATIQMEWIWIGHTEREGVPFDIEEFLPSIEGRRCTEWLRPRDNWLSLRCMVRHYGSLVYASPSLEPETMARGMRHVP